MKTDDSRYKKFVEITFLVSNIPDNVNDNDPILIESLQAKYDNRFKELKESFARQSSERAKSSLIVSEIGFLEHSFIEREIKILTGVALSEFKILQEVRIKRYLAFLEDQKRRISKPVKTQKERTFEGLFFKKETAEKIDRIFKENEYTKDGNWIDSGKMKRIATAFYVLKDPDPEINVIRPGKDTSQLRVFCKHYGIIAKDKGGDVTIKNLLTRPQYDTTKKSDYLEFVKLFNELK